MPLIGHDLFIVLGARSGVVGWGTMLQAGRSRDWVPMRWIFFSLRNPSSCTVALGSNLPLTEMSTRNLHTLQELVKSFHQIWVQWYWLNRFTFIFKNGGLSCVVRGTRLAKYWFLGCKVARAFGGVGQHWSYWLSYWQQWFRSWVGSFAVDERWQHNVILTANSSEWQWVTYLYLWTARGHA
jgi:hypothetical protein